MIEIWLLSIVWLLFLGHWLLRMKNFKKFQTTVLAHWRKNGRHNLPWRKTTDPYKILVSEMMLQQTQVARVIPKYREFLNKYPTVKKLAAAPLIDVLRVWSGLGYNRRAKYLHDAAKAIVGVHEGLFPKGYEELCALPGVGDYTAKAVRVFAHKESEILIETNIRTVFLHHYSHSNVLQKTAIRDSEILRFAQDAAKGKDPREWHWALMDYGAYLKKSGVKLNPKSAHYSKQSKFEGSLRQVRGAILRAYSRGEKINGLQNRYNGFNQALASLARDGLLN